MSPHDATINVINHWTSHLDQNDFINEVRGRTPAQPIDQGKFNQAKKKIIKNAYKKIHDFINANQKVFNFSDADLIEKLADRVNSVGLYFNCPDSNVQKIYDLADQLHRKAIQTKVNEEIGAKMPEPVKKLILDYAKPTSEEYIEVLSPYIDLANGKIPYDQELTDFIIEILNNVTLLNNEKANALIEAYAGVAKNNPILQYKYISFIHSLAKEYTLLDYRPSLARC